ncbi:MAG: SUMF1/EgtB/PvdO family nonheme iron enzyme, partial [Thermoanaerobaculia bacterium]
MTWEIWLPPVRDFLSAETGLLGSLRSLVVVLGALVAIVAALRRYVFPGDKVDESPPHEAEEGTASPETEVIPEARPEVPAIAHSTVAKGRGVAIGGSANRNLIVTGDYNFYESGKPQEPPVVSGSDQPSSPDLEQVTDRYLTYLRDRYRYLDLKGMGVADRVPVQLPLLELYVPLQARPELPPGETWERGASGKEAVMAGRKLSAEDAERLGRRLSEPRQVVELVGENDGLVILGDPGSGKTTFMKYLAVELAMGRGEELGLGDRLPVLVPLSAFSHALSAGDVRLDDFIGEYFHSLGCDEAVKQVISGSLEEGRALLLLDGLDEVREPGLRQTVVQRVADFFSFHRKAGSKFVITSRIVGYREVRAVVEGLSECTLVDFDDDEITAFVGKWTAAIERQASGATEVAEADAERERRELLAAVERNEGVRRLAANPLLLTILALMKRQGVALPERRVELYDQYVKTLLSTWNRARGLGRPPVRDLDVVETVRILAPLALWMHEVDPGLGLVKRQELVRKLEAVFDKAGEKDPMARGGRFLSDVREHAGLLLERGPAEYGFIHLTFEEYLAAVAIALEAQGDAKAIAGRLVRHLDDPAWREVSLLLVGYVGLIQQLNAVAGRVLERLVRDRRGKAGQAVVLAGEALLDVGATGVTPESRVKVIAGLVSTMQSDKVEPRRRRQAGLVLGRLGWRPEDLEEFVEIPPGPFLYGDGKEEREIEERFWIGKVPVTNLHFARFVDDDGYQRREYWTDEGWGWKEKRKRKGPLDHGEEFLNPIFPRVGVTLYEAGAYCRWLTASTNGFAIAGVEDPLSAGRVVARLPTGEEWERAARGTEGRVYPWGGTFEIGRVNTEESGAMGTTAVCTYPAGRNPEGLWDMSGNVWEWIVAEQRNLCGGSYFLNKDIARCAARYGAVPGFFYYFI